MPCLRSTYYNARRAVRQPWTLSTPGHDLTPDEKRAVEAAAAELSSSGPAVKLGPLTGEAADPACMSARGAAAAGLSLSSCQLLVVG